MDVEKPDYSGMTVNERLFVAGLIRQWDSAVASGDKHLMVSLLMQVELGARDADAIVEAVLKDPKRYGF